MRLLFTAVACLVSVSVSSQVSFKLHSGTLLINDDVDISIDDADYILFGASISFQKENLIYSSEFYSAHEYGFFNPRPHQYFQQIGILIGKKKKRIQYSAGLTIFRGELRTTGPYIGQYPSDYFVNVGIASKMAFDLIKNKRFLMTIDLNTILNFKYSAVFPTLSVGYKF